ncbi:MAG: cyanoexosortase B [Leptolyngbya foveolarum]|uniref:Cyanoexosortase B n=1 Tax=Leptolyngbya foveolarum TaxID=47253 RepID=A0A2W4V1T5_9CYAN|nr:MAG: cyanoexosortase B [Leptolyngbya foveolarum]
MLAFKSKPQIPLEWITLGLVALLYGPLLAHWVEGWLDKSISIQHEYFSHGLLGIPFAAYLVWEKRSRWQALPNQIHWLGLPLLAIAAAFYSSSLVDMINLSLPLLLAGLLLSLKGWAGFKLSVFPWILVLLSTPTQLPYLMEPYILPLQGFIAAVAGFILLQINMDVQVDGIYLSVGNQLVEVAPHCAGLKMLFTSLYMGLILTYWTGLNRSKLRTALFFVGILAVSVVGNIVRNATLTFFHGSEMDAAFAWLHDSWGGDLYSAAMLGLLVLLVSLLENYVPSSLNIAVQGAGATLADAPKKNRPDHPDPSAQQLPRNPPPRDFF